MYKIAMLVGILILSGCKKSPSGDEASPEKKLEETKKTEAPNGDEKPSSPPSAVDDLTSNDEIDIPEECLDNNYVKEHGVLQANLITKEILNGEANQFLEYELYIVDCNRGLKTFGHAPMRFHLEAQSASMVMDHPYTISDTSGRELSKGRLRVIVGKDIYGATGEGRYHTEMDPLFLTADLKRLRLKVDISNIRFTPGFGNPGSDQFMVRTFVGFGQTIPSERHILFKVKTD